MPDYEPAPDDGLVEIYQELRQRELVRRLAIARRCPGKDLVAITDGMLVEVDANRYREELKRGT